MTEDDPLSHSLLLPAFLSGRLHVAEHEDAVDRHGGAPALPARRPPDPGLPPPLPLPHLLTVLPLEQTGMQISIYWAGGKRWVPGCGTQVEAEAGT